MIRTLIVDDEPLAREGLRLLLAGESDVEIVGEAADAGEAERRIAELEPDLLLLDVQMPGADGFELLRRIAGQALPAVVFVSAHDAFALRAFEVHALDYLLKPPSRERLAEALRRVRESRRRDDPAGALAIRDLIESRGGTPAPWIERFVVRDRQRFRLVPVREATRIEAAGNYAEIHTPAGTHLIRDTMAALERRLDPARFARIHRSTIVSIEHVTEIEPDGGGDYLVTLDDGTKLKMTRPYRERLLPRA